MNPHIAKWKAEHANFGRLLDLIDSQIAIFHDGERPDYELMLEVMHYMTTYPDLYHHRREDLAFEVVFARDPAHAAVADELAAQHVRIAHSGAKLVQDLGAIIDGVVLPRAAVEADAAEYSRFMRQHMQHEEADIFPAVERLLDAKDWLLIDSKIHFISDPIFGDAVAKRYTSLHQQIAKRAGCGCSTIS
ncbi:MAG TPA: hemerythrin domain-containing protein [Denitromonas sp.]|mgnify:CR=1 FL=1|uniref:hemerythrin domain-containing protein n=1 Tax=Denitromonas sp. TaxID=2734609 RepID=UPI001D51E488|nr:hemerythrin domain-containing protein [Rhodocyclaceae bacterium]MCP5221321.1 hemerythrin domain-containing protein [Zoogloeaceae bacterium]HPR08291.1 hemerythrin domain-containing protein [Denitromonas sp.]HQU89541.1 hemerythrin domain-containing protein [Denitromonas sp.]HQV16003.1 hemerythrin domain-containing protein [Denitromonas sp.]